MTLCDLIVALTSADPDRIVDRGFANAHSYRGNYAALAFSPAPGVTVASMLQRARSALGTTYAGWKGGEFTMGPSTQCYLADDGCDGEPIDESLLLSMLTDPIA